MSYAFQGFGADCPPGFVQGPEGCVAGTSCPPGFKTVGSECWPSGGSACKTIGAFYFPGEPDRCKKACPPGTMPDASNVCLASPVNPTHQESSIFTPVNIGIGVLGLLGLAVIVSAGGR